MPKKHQEEEHGESAPLWIISFADLVTLMLSFFVILAAGNPKETSYDPDFAEIVSAVQSAFKNLQPAEAEAGTPSAGEFKAMVKALLALAKQNGGALNKGDSQEKGIHGRSFRVRRIRDGMEITMGGPVMFEPFAARPTTAGEEQLDQVIAIVRGRRNIIEIRGHAAEEPWPADWTYQDMMKLSYARAEYVAQKLIESGTDPRAVRLVAAGANEPVAREVYDANARGDNRRVEIFVRESLIDDYLGQPPAPPAQTTPSATQPTSKAAY